MKTYTTQMCSCTHS